MRCFQHRHRFYCGVDLHARTMFAHVLDADGKTVFEDDLPADPAAFLDTKVDDPVTFGLLRTVPGIGQVLGLTLLYEVDDIARFPEPGNFLSYARLVRCPHESAGKAKGAGGKKIGNAHLKWAFSEAACLLLRACPAARAWLQRRERKKGKKKALSILEAKLGRTVYHLWRKQVPFDLKRFLAG